eukprot:m.232121 g.232121  ORF g.232121 m.232121 type:complete len:345 (-) comp18584_c0_seq1:26-1060(-)
MAVPTQSNLVAVGILEKDTFADVSWAWIFPQFPEEIRDAIVHFSGIAEENATFAERKDIFGHVGDTWYYASVTASSLPEVPVLLSAVLAKDFNPQMYNDLNTLFLELYSAEGSGPAVQQAFVSVFVKGSLGKRFNVASYDVRRAHLKGSIKELVKTFGIESILLFVAVLLRRRVAVYCPDQAQLLATVRALPLFVYSRRDWNIVRPLVRLTESDLRDTAAPSVAGYLDGDVEQRTDLWDVLVNVPAGTITVSPQAEEDFALGKVHKEIAQYLVSAAADDSINDQAIVTELVTRTEDLLSGLRSLGTADESGRVTVAAETIKGRKMPASMQRFLCNLAAAENMLA